MRKRLRSVRDELPCVASQCIALWAPVAFAHHSPAGYDMQAQRTIEGTVTEYDWGNPHVYISVRENGSDQVWVVEAFASTAMKSYGWSPQTLVAGDRVVVVGNPGRNPDADHSVPAHGAESRCRCAAVRRSRRAGARYAPGRRGRPRQRSGREPGRRSWGRRSPH